MFFDFVSYPRQSFDSPDTAPTILASRAWKPPMRDKALTRVFMGMQLFGWAGYTLIIWTVFLSRKIHKHPVWIMFCLSWLISCVSYVLLFLAGEMDSNEPNHTLCLVQACLIYAVPVLTASATLALIIHLWFNVRTVVFHIETRHARTRDFLLCLFPYIPALCFFFGVLWYALEKPEDVKPGDSCMYCVVGTSFPGKASAIYVALILASGVGIEAVIATTLYNNWRSYTRSSRDSFALIIRVVLFTAFGFMSIVISLVYLSHSKHGAVADVFMGLLPVFSFFIFGSQLDFIYTWFPCLRRPSPECAIPSYHKASMSSVTKPLFLLHGARSETISTFGTPPSMTSQSGWKRADDPNPSPSTAVPGLHIHVTQHIPVQLQRPSQPRSPSRVSPVMIISRKWNGAMGLERERARPAKVHYGQYAHLPSEEDTETFAVKVARGRTI